MCLDAPNFTPCDDGDACTRDDMCINGSCTGVFVSCLCSGADNSCAAFGNTQNKCELGTCIDGSCELDMDLEGSECSVLGGECSGTPGHCKQGECAIDGGQCVDCVGSSCDDGNPCTAGDICLGNGLCTGLYTSCACAGAEGKNCTQSGDDTETCRQGICTDGECVAADSNGDLCIPPADSCAILGQCQNGSCVADESSTTCLPTGICDFRSCDDGDAQTEGDRCINGVCVGVRTSCKNLSDGEVCSPDGNPLHSCAQGICTEGECVPVDHTDEPCEPICFDGPGRCDGTSCIAEKGATVLCEDPRASPNECSGTTCDDGNTCTSGDICFRGQCIGEVDDCTCIGSEGELCEVGEPCGTRRCASGSCNVVEADCSCDGTNGQNCRVVGSCERGLCTNGACVPDPEFNAICCGRPDGTVCPIVENGQCVEGRCRDEVCIVTSATRPIGPSASTSTDSDCPEVGTLQIRPTGEVHMIGTDLEILYSINQAPNSPQADRVTLQVRNSSDTIVFKLTGLPTSPGSHVATWTKLQWNQLPFAGAFANPKNGPYRIEVIAESANFSVDGGTCCSNSKDVSIQTMFRIKATIKDEIPHQVRGQASRAAGLSDLANSIAVFISTPIGNLTLPSSFMQVVDISEFEKAILTDPIPPLDDGVYKIIFLGVRDAVGNFHDADQQKAGIQDFEFEVVIR